MPYHIPSGQAALSIPEQFRRLIRSLSDGTGLLAILEQSAVAAAELTGADHADVTLFDPYLRRLVPPRSNRVFMHQGDDDAAGWVRENGTALIVPDVNYAASGDDLTLYNRDIASYVGVPISTGSQVDGALLVFCRLPRSFDSGEVELLESIAGLAASGIKQHRLQQDFGEASRILLRLSLTDPGTGVATRYQFEQLLAREWHRAVAEGLPLAAMHIAVEVTAGNGPGTADRRQTEQALARTARILQSSLYRAGDVIARIGEKRLALLLPETDEAGAVAIARRLRRDVAQLLNEDSDPSRVRLVIGISSYDALLARRGSGFTPSDLDRLAAEALEQAAGQPEAEALRALSLS